MISDTASPSTHSSVGTAATPIAEARWRRGGWRWKDEDEFEEALQLGLFDRGQAGAIRAEGNKVIAGLRRLLPTGWETWLTDPTWPCLDPPTDWERIDGSYSAAPRGTAPAPNNATTRVGVPWRARGVHAEMEAEVQPDSVSDDLGREAEPR